MLNSFKTLTLATLFAFCAITSASESYPIHLERATASEVAEEFSIYMGQQLDNCFAVYKAKFAPDAKVITKRTLSDFQSNYPYDGSPADAYCYAAHDVKTIVLQLMEQNDRARVSPKTVKSWLKPWALEQVQPAVVNGYVKSQKLPSNFLESLRKVQNKNAISREQNPEGIDLKTLRDQWLKVGNSRLDQDFLNPVILDPSKLQDDQIFKAMREAFPSIRKLSYKSSGEQAIEEFWKAGEGPDGDEAFEIIAKQLNLPSIKKRFFFVAEGDSWSSHALLVLDEHGQMFGLQMGYSE